jgi:hypothetical protein
VRGAIEDKEDADPENLSVNDADLRIIRGGVYHSPSARIRSAFRDSSRPLFSYYAFGFRVARTLPEETPDQPEELTSQPDSAPLAANENVGQ